MKLKNLLSLCCTLTIALGLGEFRQRRRLHIQNRSEPLITTRAPATKISMMPSIASELETRSIMTSLRSNMVSHRNSWKPH